MARRWLTNHPRNQVEDFRVRTNFIITIDKPKATPTHSVERLTEIGMVGVYTTGERKSDK